MALSTAYDPFLDDNVTSLGDLSESTARVADARRSLHERVVQAAIDGGFELVRPGRRTASESAIGDTAIRISGPDRFTRFRPRSPPEHRRPTARSWPASASTTGDIRLRPMPASMASCFDSCSPASPNTHRSCANPISQSKGQTTMLTTIDETTTNEQIIAPSVAECNADEPIRPRIEDYKDWLCFSQAVSNFTTAGGYDHYKAWGRAHKCLIETAAAYQDMRVERDRAIRESKYGEINLPVQIEMYCISCEEAFTVESGDAVPRDGMCDSCREENDITHGPYCDECRKPCNFEIGEDGYVISTAKAGGCQGCRKAVFIDSLYFCEMSAAEAQRCGATDYE